MSTFVWAAPGRMGGDVCIGHTRITTATMQALADERGLDTDAIIALYPGLTAAEVGVALWWEDEEKNSRIELALLRSVLSEYLAGNRIVIEPNGDAYWYSPEGDDDGCLEPHNRNDPATADEVALIASLREEVGLP